jgi:hypothetical protein
MEDFESIPVYTPDFALLNRVSSLLGGEGQFKDLPTVRLLHSAVHTDEEIITNLSKLESTFQRPIFEYSSQTAATELLTPSPQSQDQMPDTTDSNQPQHFDDRKPGSAPPELYGGSPQ